MTHQSGYDIDTILDAPIAPPSPTDARRVALHAVAAGRNVAERAMFLEQLGLREVLS